METAERMAEMIAKILAGRVENHVLREELHEIDPEEIYEGDNILHSDAYFTLLHYINGEEKIREIEWVYLLKCLRGEEKFSFDTKEKLILKITDKRELIEEFVSASMAADRAQKIGNARVANELLDRKEKIRAALEDDPASYKALLTPLLKHENARVRLEAGLRTAAGVADRGGSRPGGTGKGQRTDRIKGQEGTEGAKKRIRNRLARERVSRFSYML